jgi:hypothetical protein
MLMFYHFIPMLYHATLLAMMRAGMNTSIMSIAIIGMCCSGMHIFQGHSSKLPWAGNKPIA